MVHTPVQQLALSAKYGDQQTLEQLLVYHEIRSVIYKIAANMVGAAEADDVYQDVCLKITQNIHTWQGTNKVTTWVGSITRNVCIDHLRKLKLHRIFVTDTPPDSSVAPDQIRSYARQEMLEIARTAIQRLTQGCLDLMGPFVLQALERYEIKAMLDMPKSTFHRHWNGCYEELQKEVQKIVGDKWEKL